MRRSGNVFSPARQARILASLPGMGPILGVEFLVCVGDIRAFESADRLAAYARVSSRRLATRVSGWVTAGGCEGGTRP